MSTILFQPDTLKTKITAQIASAQQKGALKSIPTEYHLLKEQNLTFILRVVSNLERKEKAQKQQSTSGDFDPFLPYDPDLFVTDISETHLCLLNKYNVMDEHLLIVTREFEEQENLLDYADFWAVGAMLNVLDGLVFYNAGKIAGASVRHKHLQLVPRELAPNQGIPIESVLEDAEFEHAIGIVRSFRYSHAYLKLVPPQEDSLTSWAQMSLASYQQLLTALALAPRSPYNLLMTREWMLIVPRSQASYQNIGINALGFAGAMLVSNQQQLEIVKEYQPLNILKAVGMDFPSPEGGCERGVF